MLSVEDRLEAADGEIERLWGLLDNAGERVEQLRAEVTEQARLLGISAEKELALRAENERMRNTLVSAGYTDEGGELWKPQLGKSVLPVFEENERLKAELAETKKDAGYFVGMINEMLAVDIDGPIMVALGKLADKHDANGTLPCIEEVREAVDSAMKGK